MKPLHGPQAFLASTLAIAAVLCVGAARATTLKTLYSFCAEANCTDGSDVRSLTMDQSGTLYGTTVGGGEYGNGTIFRLAPGNGGWTFTRLYSFCQDAACPDGQAPSGRLVIDVAGNLYVVTYGGGHGQGVVFELAHDAAHDTWTYNVLYQFCVDGGFCLDGAAPAGTGLTYAAAASGAPYDGIAPLFGSTSEGGKGGDANNAGAGTIFAMVPARHGHWKHEIIYNFCSRANRPRCNDGGPENGLTMSADGAALYGPAAGGANGGGVIYKIAPLNARWTQSIVHAFGPFGSEDGYQPNGAVAQAPSGAIIGTTAYGGGNDIDQYREGGGTLFSAGADYAILHSFCARRGCADGEYPAAPVAIDAVGNIFGTTGIGGNAYEGVGGGVLFRYGADGTFEVLHKFCSLADCADGVFPGDGVSIAPSGKLYGTTSAGGAHPTDGFSAGTVYELTP
jgi:uncharacterized repeat protein (TIGR03803 family)